jgi:hypothetical protein
MFKLIALIVSISSGEPEVVSTMQNKIPFPSEEKCMNYFDADSGAASKAKLQEMVDSVASEEKLKLEIQFRCIQVPDNSI